MNFTFVCLVEILKHDISGNKQVAEKIWEDVLFLFKVFLFFKPLYSDFFLPCFFLFILNFSNSIILILDFEVCVKTMLNLNISV